MIEQIPLSAMSIANLTVGGGDPVELIEAAGAAGFGAVGLLLRSATGKPLTQELVGRPENIRAVRSACERHNVRVFDVEAFLLSPETDLELHRQALATGAELGASYVSAIGTEWLHTDHLLSPDQRIDLFGRLCDMAAEYGLTVGVEFMLYRDIRTLGEAWALVRAARCGNAGVILDFLHFHRCGTPIAELAALPEGAVAYTQLCDAEAEAPPAERLAIEARTKRLHLGDGIIDIAGILDAIPSRTPLVIETPVAADADLSVRAKVERAADRTRQFFD